MPSANKTTHLKLNQWLGNENVKRQDFYDDNTKIDKAYGDIKTKLDTIELTDKKIQITDLNDRFTGTTLDKVLDEIDTKVNGLELKADKVSYTDTVTQLGASSVQQAIEKIAAEIIGTTAQLRSANDTLESIIG